MNHETENSMVLGAEYEESTERPEPDYDEVRQQSVDKDSDSPTPNDPIAEILKDTPFALKGAADSKQQDHDDDCSCMDRMDSGRLFPRSDWSCSCGYRNNSSKITDIHTCGFPWRSIETGYWSFLDICTGCHATRHKPTTADSKHEPEDSLNQTLVDITLSQQIDRLDDLCERLEGTTYGKRQA